MHKAVLIDLGKTLINFDFERAYRAIGRFCSCAASEIPERIAPAGLAERFECGWIEPRDFFLQLAGALHLRLDYEGFCRIWNSIFGEPLIPESVLEGLAARYRLVLVSNTNPIHFEALRREYPFLRLFHETALSYEVHAIKPQPAIFQAAIERAGCLPGECFYADDIASFAEVARGLGMDAVRFEGWGQLEQDLTARGIRWS
ncbi:MAG: HAD family hydrolase [Bryobacteraceae bacterium]|jgi:putative hydrolase of the HAD superfamily